MRTLTIKQPHVAAIFAGLKPYETRSWQTHHRGPLAIHAGARFDHAALERMNLGRVAWENHAETNLALPAGAVALGAVIGVVELVACISVEDVPENQRGWGDFSPGRWAWCLERPRLLPVPVPCRGALSLWTAPDLVVDPESQLSRPDNASQYPRPHERTTRNMTKPLQTTIKMTAEQTAVYDDGDGPAQDDLMRSLRAEARRLHEEHGRPVEIHTADGIVADVVQ